VGLLKKEKEKERRKTDSPSIQFTSVFSKKAAVVWQTSAEGNLDLVKGRKMI